MKEAKFKLEYLSDDGINIEAGANAEIYTGEDAVAFINAIALLLGVITEGQELLPVESIESFDEE